MNWSKLDFDERGVARQFIDHVVAPIRAVAAMTLDVLAVVGGLAVPGMKRGMPCVMRHCASM